MRSSRYRYIDQADITVKVRSSFDDVDVDEPHPDGLIWVGLDCSPSTEELYPIIIWHDDGSGVNTQLDKLEEIIGDPYESYCHTSTPSFYDGLTSSQTFDFRYQVLPIGIDTNRGISEVSAQGARSALFELHNDIEERDTMRKTMSPGETVHATFCVTFLEQQARTRVPFFPEEPTEQQIRDAITLMHIPVYLLTDDRPGRSAPGPDIETLCAIPALETNI